MKLLALLSLAYVMNASMSRIQPPQTIVGGAMDNALSNCDEDALCNLFSEPGFDHQPYIAQFQAFLAEPTTSENVGVRNTIVQQPWFHGLTFE